MIHMVCCRDSCSLVADFVAGKNRGGDVEKAHQYSAFGYFLPFYNTLTTKATRFYKKK